MRRTLLLAAALTAACRAPAGHAAAAGSDAAPVRAETAPAPAPPPFPPEILSLHVKTSIAVRFDPSKDAKSLGVVESDAYVGYSGRTAPGDGTYCERYLEIRPRGWICEKYLEPSKKPPHGEELPALKPGEIVPGVYGKVNGQARVYKNLKELKAGHVLRTLAGSVTVRKVGEVAYGGRKYWKTEKGELLDGASVSLHTPSTFNGVRLDLDGAPRLPFAWAQSRKDLAAKVPVYGDKRLDARVVRKVDPRSILQLLARSDDGWWYQIGEGEWLRGADLHVARDSEPPPGTVEQERWLDVDTDEQVVVAFEGRKPMYATMVSSGSPKWPTPPGVYRIWLKFAETDMNGQMGDEQPYSVATVPWTMFFARDLGFHTAYWHDRFGEPRSHGCLNLSPIDARWLYFWADPDVPAGWSMSQGIAERPGSPVRVHNAAFPNPEFRGYARVVRELQLARMPPSAAHADEPEVNQLRDAGPPDAEGADAGR